MIKRMKLLLLLLAVKLEKSSEDCSTDNSWKVLDKLWKASYIDDYDDSSYKWWNNTETDTTTTCKNLTNLIEAIEELGNHTFLEIENSNLSTSQFSVLHKELKKLQIFNSTIPQLKENTFDGFIKLEVLALEGTKINLLNENIFIPFKNLKTLNMNYNKLKKLYSGSFDGLGNLKILHLSHNNLSVIENGVFNQLLGLEELYLSHNELQTVDSLFSSLNSLKILDLRTNYIYKIPSLSISITELLLGDNQIRSWDNIDELNKLTYLDVSNNYLETYDAIGALYNIRTLNLSSNNIKVLDKSIISNLTVLYNLDMSYNAIKNIEIGTFHKNFELNILNISYNFLEKIMYGMLSKNIYILDLSFNKITTFRETIDSNDHYLHLNFRILLEGNSLKCRDLVEYKKYLYGKSFDTENINGVNCITEDISSDEDIKIIEKKLNESALYKFLNSNTTVVEKVSEVSFRKLKEKILKIIKDKESAAEELEGHTSRMSIVNLILTSTILIVLCVILLLLYFNSSYKRLHNIIEFSENSL